MSFPDDSHPRRNLGGSQASSNVVDSASPALSTSTANSTGTLTPGSSPPLIVAFLAIGLFMAAMIAIIGWRRMTYRRGFIVRVGTGSPGVDPQKAIEYFGEQPKLWDLEAQRPIENEDGLTWQGMMPLSAAFKKPPAETLSPPGNTSVQVVGTSTVPPQLEHFGRHFRRPTRSQPPTLQVAMAIAMPSPHIHECESWMHESPEDISNHTHEPFGDDRMEYSLGLMDIPWHSAER